MTTARADQRKMSEYLCFDIGGTAIKYGIVSSEEVFVMKDQSTNSVNLLIRVHGLLYIIKKLIGIFRCPFIRPLIFGYFKLYILN